MPRQPLKIEDLELAVRVLRLFTDGDAGAFESTARLSGLAKTNVVEALGRVEDHFGLDLIARSAAPHRRRTGNVTSAGRLVLTQGPRILWFHEELERDLAALPTG